MRPGGQDAPPPEVPAASPRRKRSRRKRDRCPDCGAGVRGKSLNEGGGAVCSKKCGWWFCY